LHGLDADAQYDVKMSIRSACPHVYRYQEPVWIPQSSQRDDTGDTSGVLNERFTHNESMTTGDSLMGKTLTFNKMKIGNDKQNHPAVVSMRKSSVVINRTLQM